MEQLIARPYQVILEEIASQRNSIIHLPTGSGKTFIAIQLIKRFIKDLKKPWGQGGKRTFFLVNNVPLVQQQKKVIEKLCPVTVGGYSGEDRVDYWNKATWDLELAAHEAIVMTGQILSDMLTHSYIRVEDINLLIFDECHHAVEDQPMRAVMKHFELCPVEKQPRILGLTATLLNGNVVRHKVESTLKDLETTFHATIATVDEMTEVLSHSTNPNEIIKTYKPFDVTIHTTQATSVLKELQIYIMRFELPRIENAVVKLKVSQENITTDPKKIVKIVYNMVESMIRSISSMGTYGGALCILAYIILLERLKRRAASKEQQTLYQLTISYSLSARMILLKAMEKDQGYDRVVKHSSEQIMQLLNVLKEYNPARFDKPGVAFRVNVQKQPLSAIIFTRERFTAKILFNIVKDVIEVNPEEFGFIKHDFITSFNVNPMKSVREDAFNKKISKGALLRFCNKDLNCLISTSVIEEGVDVSQCLLVVRYDIPLEYRSYIQSKGRARSAVANYVLLVDKTQENKFMSQYRNFQETEQFIYKLLVGKCSERLSPSQDEIAENLYNDEDIPSFVTPNGAQLSALSAIRLLNRYCSILPHDKFTIIIPTWLEENDSKGRRIVTIIMPLGCPVKEPIRGMPMQNRKAAKRSAALNTCIRLFEEGELDAITLLPKRYGNVNFDETDVSECFLNWPKDESDEEVNLNVPAAGTKKRKRKHEKIFSSYLKGPEENKALNVYYLHVINFLTTFSEPKDSREKCLFELLKQHEGYGLLTLHPLPKICNFPMFLTVGEVEVSLQTNYAVISLDSNQFERINEFHYFLFNDVLSLAKKYIVFDGTANCMYVVPIVGENDKDINWELILAEKEIPSLEEPSFEDRKSMEVDCDAYRHAVVTPWYRTVSVDRYIVSNVLEYMTPKSKFDSGTYNSYEHYFENRYNLTLVGSKDQPLLEVRKINTRMNCLLPRAITIKAFSEKLQKLVSANQGDDNPKGFAEVFIPEFCVKYDFPGVYWYKAMMLPSITHRVTHLLVAHELRAEIALATKYGKPALSKYESWKPILIDEHIAATSLRSYVEEPAQTNTIDRLNQPAGKDSPTSFDPDSSTTFDPESAKPFALKSMKESIYKLQKQKLNKEYPWNEKLEPLDIERNISTVSVMDVECYDEFVNTVMYEKTEQANLRSPPCRPNQKLGALLPPPLKYNDKIDILSLKPTGLGPELRDVLAALTTINSHDTFDLERAETLGDAFLKFTASLYLFHKFPKLNEGQLTNVKGRLIGNKNLYYAGEKARIGGRMKVEHFSPQKDFLVPGYFTPMKLQNFIEEKQIRPTFLLGTEFTYDEVLSGKMTEESWSAIVNKFAAGDGSVEPEAEGQAQNVMQGYVRCQVVPDKVVADCVEALIGTYLFSGGISAGVKLLEWFKIIPEKDNLEEMLHRPGQTVIKEGKATVDDIEFLLNYTRNDIEKILEYKFKDPSLILEALSHPSYIRNRLTASYERLEFLGDAILDFLITAHIYENSRDFKPGDMTDLRSALVNNVTFAAYVVKLGLHKYLCSQLNPCLDKVIMTFVEHQEQREHQILEDVLYLIYEEDCYVADYVEVPKVLSDIFESLVGAIYLDSCGDLATVWKVVYRIMCREIDLLSARIPKQPVRVLYENMHACPRFGDTKLTKTEIPRVMVPVEVSKDGKVITLHGFGGNKFQAKRAAAKLALKFLSL